MKKLFILLFLLPACGINQPLIEKKNTDLIIDKSSKTITSEQKKIIEIEPKKENTSNLLPKNDNVDQKTEKPTVLNNNQETSDIQPSGKFINNITEIEKRNDNTYIPSPIYSIPQSSEQVIINSPSEVKINQNLQSEQISRSSEVFSQSNTQISNSNLTDFRENINKEVPKQKYDINYPVPDNARAGFVDFIFKDDAKIRYYLDKNTFISKAGLSLQNIIALIKKYNPKIFGFDMSSVKSEDQTELKFEKEDKELELLRGYEIPNELSFYTFEVKDISIKELIEEIRKEPYVLSANYSEPSSFKIARKK